MNKNPFVAFPGWLKTLVWGYFLIFIVIGNGFQLVTVSGLNLSKITISLMNILIGFLYIWPILFFKYFGILHPFAFAWFLNTIKSIFKNPFRLIEPFTTKEFILKDTAFFTLPDYRLYELNLQSLLFELLTLVFLYIGYFMYSNKNQIRLKNIIERPHEKRFYLLSGVVLLIAIAFIFSQGGVTQWIVKWGVEGGRAVAIGALGPIARFLKTAYFVPLIWFVVHPKAHLNPIFWVVTLITAFLGFLATGSRSSIVEVVLGFVTAWMILKNRIPTLLMAVFPFAFFIVFGLLGQIRNASTFNDGRVNWSDVNVSLESNFDKATAEAKYWAETGASLAIYHFVPEEVDYLLGKTYVTVFSFWIPRAIWPNKPHGAGFYTGRQIFGRNSGVPPGATAEAFWNFGVLGVIFIALLNGFFLKFLVINYRYHHTHLGFAILYVIILTTNTGFSSLGLTALLQKLIYVVLGLKFLKLI